MRKERPFSNFRGPVHKATYQFRVVPGQFGVIETAWRSLSMSKISALHSGLDPNGPEIFRQLDAGQVVRTHVDGVAREFRRAAR